jgi:hypothetical protein
MSNEPKPMETITLAELFPPQPLAEAEAERTLAESSLQAATEAKAAALAENKEKAARLKLGIRAALPAIQGLKDCVILKKRNGIDSSADQAQLDQATARLAQMEAELKDAVSVQPELLKAAEAKVEEAQQRLDAAENSEKQIRAKNKRLAQAFADAHQPGSHEVGTVIKLKTLKDAVSHFYKVAFRIGCDGQVSTAHLGRLLSVEIKEAKVVSHIPAALSWLRRFEAYQALPCFPYKVNLTEEGFIDDRQFDGLFQAAPEHRYGASLDTPACFYVEETGQTFANRSALERARNLADFTSPLEDALKAYFEELKALGPLDLDSNKSSSMLREIIQTAWKAASANIPSQPRFLPGQTKLTAAKIDQLIGSYWRAFLDSPWEPGIEETYALLKHRCTRGETPNVFAYDTCGHFGFRVRTADHDWIKGEIYCPPGNLSPSKMPDPLSVTNHPGGEDWVSELGEVKFLIRGKTSRT